MDLDYLLLLQDFREATGGVLNEFLTLLSTLSVGFYITTIALVIFWSFDKEKGAAVLIANKTATFFNAILKLSFCVYRPWIRNSDIEPLDGLKATATGYSFPSGHSASVSGLYSALICAFRKKKGLCISFAVIIALTMFSRNYVGVHTPQDVLVGCCVGIAAALLISYLFKLVNQYKNADIWILICSFLACAAAILYISLKSYPADYVNGVILVDPEKMKIDGYKDFGWFFGAVSGWFVERRFVKFDMNVSLSQKVLRSLAGGLLFILYYTAVVDTIVHNSDSVIIYFLICASAPFLFMTVYPFIFKKIEKQKE